MESHDKLASFSAEKEREKESGKERKKERKTMTITHNNNSDQIKEMQDLRS